MQYLNHEYQNKHIFLKEKRLKQEWQKSPAGTRQTEGKKTWFGLDK
jgi:hypothetical protein